MTDKLSEELSLFLKNNFMFSYKFNGVCGSQGSIAFVVAADVFKFDLNLVS